MVAKFKRKELILPLIFGLLISTLYYVFPLKYFALMSLGFVGLIGIMYSMKIGILAGVFLIPFLPDTLNIYYIIFLVMVFIYDFTVKQKYSLNPNIMDIPIGLYAVIILIATITSINPMGSFRDLTIHFVSIGLVFVMVNTIKTLEDFNKVVTVLVFSATIVSLIGLYQYIVGVEVKAAWVDVENNPDIRARVYSVFGNPNILAEYLVMMIPLSISLFWYSKKIHKKVIFLGTSLILILALVLTLSRGGWVGFAFSALIFMILVEKRLLLSIIPIGVGGIYFLPQTILNRIMSIFNLADSSNAYRLTMWSISMDIIKDNPIAGVGFGHLPFKQTFETYIRTMPTYHAHNTYLETAAEIGIPGLIAFLFFLFILFKYGIKNLIQQDNKYIKIMAAGVFSGLGGLLAHGAAENVLYLTKIIIHFWILVAFILILTRIKEKEEKLS